MKYSRLALITLSMMTGCAAKHEHVQTPGARIVRGCREVAIDVKTDELIVRCPLHPKVKK